MAGALWTSYDASFPAIWVKAMKKPSRAGGKPIKARRRKAATLKRRNGLKSVRRRGSAAADHETKVARLARELNEAREQQAATSEVLNVISQSEFDLAAVLEKLVEKAVRVCGAERGLIWRQDGGLYRVAASYGHSIEFLERVATRIQFIPIEAQQWGEPSWSVTRYTFTIPLRTQNIVGARITKAKWKCIAPSSRCQC